MSRILSQSAELEWEHVREYGGPRSKARDTRLVARWARQGRVEWHHLEALDWLIRRLERSHSLAGGNGERVAISRAPDAVNAAQADASRAYNAALHAVHVRAGQLCYAAVYELTQEPRIRKDALRRAIGCADDRVFAIVLNGLDELSAYLDDSAASRVSWNSRGARSTPP